MSATDMTAEDVINSLTGFDEIAIETHFGVSLTDLERKPTTALRACIFVVKTREGMSAADAKQAAMGMPLGEANDYFASDEEIDPDDPDTESGKGGSPVA